MAWVRDRSRMNSVGIAGGNEVSKKGRKSRSMCADDDQQEACPEREIFEEIPEQASEKTALQP
jgi:hypothetical protein